MANGLGTEMGRMGGGAIHSQDVTTPEVLYVKSLARAINTRGEHIPQISGFSPEMNAKMNADLNCRVQAVFSNGEEFLKSVAACSSNYDLYLLKVIQLAVDPKEEGEGRDQRFAAEEPPFDGFDPMGVFEGVNRLAQTIQNSGIREASLELIQEASLRLAESSSQS